MNHGSEPHNLLEQALSVRAAALSQLSVHSLPMNQPWSALQQLLPPVFLWHRYAVEAAVKALGGASYGYTLRGDAQSNPQLALVPASTQWAVLASLLHAIEPVQVTVPPLTPHTLPNMTPLP